MTHPNGGCYEGQRKDDQMHGYAIVKHLDGSRYEGNYKHGKRNGWGVYTWPAPSDRERPAPSSRERPATSGYHEGQWRDDKPNGFGIRVDADGSRREGLWQDGSLGWRYVARGHGIASDAKRAMIRGHFFFPFFMFFPL